MDKRRFKIKTKDIIAFAVIIAVIALLVSGIKIQSVDEYYLTHIDDINADSDTVSISITCAEVLGSMASLDPALRSYIPADGVILAENVYVLRPGDTVFDMLLRTVKHNKIQMDVRGADIGNAYILGINHLYEFDCGPLSGWRYSVNGEYPGYGSDGMLLKNGDKIIWAYTLGGGLAWGTNYAAV